MQYQCLINGAPRNVKDMRFRVNAIEKGIVGDYVGGKPYGPDPKQFRAALPYRWRAAFDRETGFWHNRDKPGGQISLSDRRGRYLTTIYFFPLEESA